MKAADNAPDGLTGEMYRHSDRCSIRKTRVFQSDLLLNFESVNFLTIIPVPVPVKLSDAISALGTVLLHLPDSENASQAFICIAHKVLLLILL